MQDKEIEDMMQQHNIEVQNEYNNILEKINSNNAKSEDYIAAITYLQILYKNADKNQINDYLETAANCARKEILSSNIAERAIGYFSLAKYCEHKKQYKEALKYYDEAASINHEYIIFRAMLRVEHLNDRKGANKDYEILLQKGDEHAIQMFNLLVKNKKTFTEKFMTGLLIAIGLVIAAVFIYMEIIMQ